MPLKYIVHEKPVGRLESNHLAMVDLKPFGFPELMEQLWLAPEEHGTFKVACLPFRAYGLALGDEVMLDSLRENVIQLVRSSGRRVLRIFLDFDLSEAEFTDLRERLIQSLMARSTAFEWSGDRHVAIDFASDGSAHYLKEIISSQLARQTVHWEWADAEGFRGPDRPI